MNIKIFLFLSILILSCNPDTEKKVPFDKSYRLFNTNVLNQNNNLPFSRTPGTFSYLQNFDTITKDSFERIDIDSIYHIFSSYNFKPIQDSFKVDFTYNSISHQYAKNNILNPTLIDLSYYSDNLFGISLGTKEKGIMNFDIYDMETGKSLNSKSTSKYDGSYYLGSRTMSDTFDQIRLVLAIDKKIFEKTYSKAEIDDREIDKKTQ